MARSASGLATARQKYFCPSLPPKIRPPIKVRPQFIDLPPPIGPLSPSRPRVIGKLMPTITQRPCNRSHYRPSNFATDVVALWWNAICPTSPLNVLFLAKNSWDRSNLFRKLYLSCDKFLKFARSFFLCFVFFFPLDLFTLNKKIFVIFLTRFWTKFIFKFDWKIDNLFWNNFHEK